MEMNYVTMVDLYESLIKPEAQSIDLFAESGRLQATLILFWTLPWR